MTPQPNRLPIRRLVAPLLLAGLVTLAGCHHEGKGDGQRTAAGQVLSGSISDGMLPYDSLRSQPPLAPGHAASDSASAASAASADSGGDGVTSGEAPPSAAEGETAAPPR